MQLEPANPHRFCVAPMLDWTTPECRALHRLFSRHAFSVTLNIFEKAEDGTPCYSYTFDPYTNKTGDIWHVFVKGLPKNALYLYRVDGPFAPYEGMRFNAGNYLLDPYARGLANTESFSGNFSAQTPPPYIDGDLAFLTEQSPAQFPKCIAVAHDDFDWQGDHPLNYPLKDCIIYEAHVKGLSCHPNAPQQHKGTYQGIIDTIPYLKELGIADRHGIKKLLGVQHHRLFCA